MEKFDVIVAGAGLVGLATAFQLSQAGMSTLVLEKEEGPALHQSGRNSGVIHTGVYYKPGSLKAKNCREGRAELLNFCEKEGVPFRKIHKLIVATREAERVQLKEIYAKGLANGVSGLKILTKDASRDWEPNVAAIEALLVPECHIVDFREVARALCKKLEVRFQEPVLRFKPEVETPKKKYGYRFFINCTGVHSDRIAGRSSHQILPFRGEYYLLKRNDITRGLVYPVPDPNFPFLGLHLTPMMNGRVEAGPNAILACAREGYKKSDFSWKDMTEILRYPGFWRMAKKYWRVGAYEIARSLSKNLFLKDLQRLTPCIEGKDLEPGSAGIRAQVVTREGKLLDDFAFERQGNVLHVINAPSPAATASFAIGKTLAKMVTE